MSFAGLLLALALALSLPLCVLALAASAVGAGAPYQNRDPRDAHQRALRHEN